MEYISNTTDERREMLKVIGVGSVEELLADIPKAVRLKGNLNLGPALSEMELKSELLGLAERNDDLVHRPCFLGAGAYDHFVPAVVKHLAFRSEFLTAYTPYQAEMSQGILQTIYEFQTMIAELTGMEVANASLYDGASALAEAAIMAVRITRRPNVLVSRAIHPNHRAVLKTYLSGTDVRLIDIPWRDGATDREDIDRRLNGNTAAILIQTPNFLGCLESAEEMAERAHSRGAVLAVSVDPMGLGLLQPPGPQGADVVIGEGQGLGNELSFGGPYLGFLATRSEFVRQMPGRVVGATVDREGKRGYCLTLQTREQHIKRERATSNICTNEALAALCATIYLSAMGKEGIREVGRLCARKAHYLRSRIGELEGFETVFQHPFFKEFTVRTPISPSRINKRLLKKGIVGGLDLSRVDGKLKNHWLLCVTEKRTKAEMDGLVDALKAMS